MTLSFEIIIEEKDFNKMQKSVAYIKEKPVTILETMYFLFDRFGTRFKDKVIIKQTNK